MRRRPRATGHPKFRFRPPFRETRDTIIAVAGHPGGQSPDTLRGPMWRDTTLTRLLNEAVRANLDVRAAEARVRGARAARTEAAFDLAPTVTFGGGLHPAAARERVVSDRRPGPSPTRISGTGASMPPGSWTCSAGCVATSRRRERSWR